MASSIQDDNSNVGSPFSKTEVKRRIREDLEEKDAVIATAKAEKALNNLSKEAVQKAKEKGKEGSSR